ncbi:site-2 protease family protein [Oxyplasma meridianum]|uniref:Site-2 protease family protein n=1 Tax=Oxyplasma meridianum TaxID=3073602 RepID=A0AAX4NEF6_9ARCH
MNRFYGGYSREIEDISLAFIMLTLSFFIAMISDNGFHVSAPEAALLLIMSALAVATAFFLHEMAHRYVARRFGGVAFFKIWPFGIIFAFITSFFGFIFAAPGAVNIGGIYRKDQFGKSALAGPLTNLVVGSVFVFLDIFLPMDPILHTIFGFVGGLNLYFGVFNMLPIPPLDGQKVMSWNLRIFIMVFAVAIILNIINFLTIGFL